ncbi:MAG: hypothetical protein GY822_03785 [Deltaproteobacteria bacterium]|nr:hypothetical protein [Deltaproteobacteria bacterium]
MCRLPFSRCLVQPQRPKALLLWRSPTTDPALIFEAKEHIAFCFSCVGRSLEPEQQLALILRDVVDLSIAESAKVAGVTKSVFRHRLAAAREQMEFAFEGLCVRVSKKGVCHQCSGLRSTFDVDKHGSEVPITHDDDANISYRKRLRVVQDADLEFGATSGLHSLLFRRLAAIERIAKEAT